MEKMILEMINAGFKFYLSSSKAHQSWETDSTFISVTGRSPEGDEISINVHSPGTDVLAAIQEAYTRFRRHVSRLPEFDMNKTIAHTPPVVDDEIRF